MSFYPGNMDIPELSEDDKCTVCWKPASIRVVLGGTPDRHYHADLCEECLEKVNDCSGICVACFQFSLELIICHDVNKEPHRRADLKICKGCRSLSPELIPVESLLKSPNSWNR